MRPRQGSSGRKARESDDLPIVRAVTFTVDASVFVNAFNPHEEGHERSKAVLARLHENAIPLVVPTLLEVEVAAAVARGRDDAELARRFAATLLELPNVVPVPLDPPLATSAAALAARHRLRGADAVYAATALRFGSALLTRDREQRERLTGVIEVLTPAEAPVG